MSFGADDTLKVWAVPVPWCYINNMGREQPMLTTPDHPRPVCHFSYDEEKLLSENEFDEDS
jgi:hypothetical protein